jgi:hypothetical protein
MSNLFSIGAVNQLSDALEEAGFSPQDLTELRQFKQLHLIKRILRGEAEIKITRHLINLDVEPKLEKGFLYRGRGGRGGIWEFTPDMEIYISRRQKKGCPTISDIEDEKGLTNKRYLNANVLDYLLENPEIIPEKWKGKIIVFAATEYCTENLKYVFVRCLYWTGQEWASSRHQTNKGLRPNFYLAITDAAA